MNHNIDVKQKYYFVTYDIVTLRRFMRCKESWSRILLLYINIIVTYNNSHSALSQGAYCHNVKCHKDTNAHFASDDPFPYKPCRLKNALDPTEHCSRGCGA